MQAIITKQEQKTLMKAYGILSELYESARKLDEEYKEQPVPYHMLGKDDVVLDIDYDTLERFVNNFSNVMEMR